MDVVIYSTALWILSIIIIVSISSIILYKQKQILTNNLTYNCNKNNLSEPFKPYNDSYEYGFSINNVLCSNLDVSQNLNTTADITFYNTTEDNSSKTDKNKTITLSSDGNASGIKTLSSTDIINSNKITTKDITNTNIIETKDINISNAFKITNKDNIKINNTKLFDLIYPIGSIYMSINSTSPATLFGGTWEQIIDRFLYPTNSEITKTGGASSVTLSIDNLPSHNHELQQLQLDSQPYNAFSCMFPNYKYKYSLLDDSEIVRSSCSTTERKKMFKPLNKAARADENDWLKIANTGKNKAFSIMPPYYRVYCWRRTA